MRLLLSLAVLLLLWYLGAMYRSAPLLVLFLLGALLLAAMALELLLCIPFIALVSFSGVTALFQSFFLERIFAPYIRAQQKEE